ncbi:hypothetical protein LCGC14_1171560 [marine sediment metagenome]|uniref:Adenylosuccinate synthetase n=1 Tax=marine sediment metagenome TaxID=412755 RepID=A0A0F9PV75_9ZZZZ
MITIVIGGQTGSEGKGSFVAWLTDPRRQEGKLLVIRTGGANAGHSMKLPDGTVFKARHVPCAINNRRAILALGPGAVVDPDYLLNEELPWLRSVGYDVKGRFYIDPMCAIIEQKHRDLVRPDFGTTKKGVAGATADRVLRTGKIARDISALYPYLADVADLANGLDSRGDDILIETAQGFGLSLTRSGHYPYCTSRDVTPGAALNDAGVPLAGPIQTILVLRTHPIRVAGNSGPLRFEVTWDKLKEESGGYIQPEYTTVTNRLRRVGRWDPELARAAVAACRPDHIVLTFFDYWRPDLANKTVLDPDAFRRIHEVEEELGVPVTWVSTGFGSIIHMEENEYGGS